MADAWVRAVDGHLVNLALCSQVQVEDSAGAIALVAFEPTRNGHYVLGRFERTDDAAAALEELAGRLGAIGVAQG